MTKQDSFESDRLIYKGINEQDHSCIVRWRSNPDLIKYFKNPVPITIESHLNWYDNSYFKDLSRYDFVIIDKETEQKVGCIGVSNINKEEQSHEINYLIGEAEFQRRGFASEAIITVISKMRLEENNISYAEIHKDNDASIKLIEKLGFSKISETGDFVKFKKRKT